MNVRFTLVAEGTTDAALLPILRWALRQDVRIREIDAQFASPFLLPRAREGLSARIGRALELFPADLLFVHRDADREPPETRRTEIQNAVRVISGDPIVVPVVPVRMMEAWLLIDEPAIRSAAGNPRGSMPLDLPKKLAAIERMPDPKASLHEALRIACGLRGRKLAKFSPHSASGLISERIRDFAALRQLGAFVDFECMLGAALDNLASARSG